MNSRALTILALIMTCTIMLPAQGPGNGGGSGGGGGSAGSGALMTYLQSLPLQTVSTAEEDAILYMRQEEKLARDVYFTLYLTWNRPIFINIAWSEQSHMDLVLWLINRYGLVDPVPTEALGVFADPVFTALYQLCVSYGSQSIENALFIGAAIEDLDLYDLIARLAQSDNSDIDTVYQNLMKGSRNHMRSFCSQLDSLGYPYSAIFLTQVEVDGVTSSSHETGVVYDENGNPL